MTEAEIRKIELGRLVPISIIQGRNAKVVILEDESSWK